MKLILIAALNQKRVIGIDGRLPWHLPDDMKRFKRLTTGHTVLMGRKTYESLGKPLRDRRNVVISSHGIPGVETYRSLDAALAALEQEEKVFIIGGGQLYAAALDRADELLLTLVENDADGDTFFPPYEAVLARKFTLSAEEVQDGYAFKDYVRIQTDEKKR